jgi:hypothetical protein
MPSQFPGSLDSFPLDFDNDDPSSVTHPDIHNDVNDAINKIEGELGTNPSGGYATVKARLDDIVSSIPAINVKEDHGAVGDGVTDDTTAFQAAINACPLVTLMGGRTVRVGRITVPPGFYIVSSLTYPTDANYDGAPVAAITLEGPGGKWRTACIARKAGTNLPLLKLYGKEIRPGGPGTAITGSYNLNGPVIKGLQFAHNGVGSAPLIELIYAQNITIEGNEFAGNAGPALQGIGWQDSRIVDNWINYCGGTVSTVADGSVVGTESLRLLSNADGNPANTVFGYVQEIPCNNLRFTDNWFTNGVSGHSGVIAISYNRLTGGTSPHRIHFKGNKIENGAMGGNPVKILGGLGWGCAWISFIDSDFTGYSLVGGGSAISWVDMVNCNGINFHNTVFDDAGFAVTHAPLRLNGAKGVSLSGYLILNTGYVTVSGDTNFAALAHFVGGDNSKFSFGDYQNVSPRTALFSGTLPANLIGPARGGINTQTPGAVTTVTIVHGCNYTPSRVHVTPANAAARDAPNFHATVDGTNITLTFASALTAATSYSWHWQAS